MQEYRQREQMEPIENAYYEAKFENAYLKAKGNAFQTFFNELMGRAHKSDYMPCRPWGIRGDGKNDGYLKSKRQLFQVYAPNEMTEREAVDKINEDFEGAKHNWGKYFNKWTFVHNAHDGIPPHVQKTMLELQASNPGIELDLWGLEEMREIFRRLGREDLESWFGFAPKRGGMGFEDIRVVLETIGSKKLDSTMPVKQIPPGKIEANQLSDAISKLLKEGMAKAFLVDDFFGKWHDPIFGERIAAAFRDKYETLRETLTPNEVFYELQTWVGSSQRGTAEHEMAVLTVIAYYFESCDIFKEPQN